MSSLRDKRSCKTEQAEAVGAARPAAVIIGRVAGIAEDGAPLVDFPGNPAGTAVPALATASYRLVTPDTPVALMFMDGDPARPLAIGVVAQPDPATAPARSVTPDQTEPEDRLTLTAPRELVLQCGRASLVLTSAGKVLIRGTYVSSRSSGMQRITGAAVQIN